MYKNFRYIYCNTSRLSNIIHSPTNTHFIQHIISSLLFIFNLIIKAKVDFGIFLFSSTTVCRIKKLKTSCILSALSPMLFNLLLIDVEFTSSLI